MLSKEQVADKVIAALIDIFELEPEKVVPEAHLYEDLDLDSLDAIDLIVRLEEETGQKIKMDELKNIRTVADIIETLYVVLKDQN